MKVLFYLAELQSVEETRAKEEVFSLWSQVNEVEVVGVVSELNASNTLGEAGKGSFIKRIVARHNKDAETQGEPLIENFCPHQSRHTFTSAAYSVDARHESSE